MRAFAITIVLFIAVIILVTANALYVNSTLERTKQLATEIYKDSTSSEALSELYDHWQKHKSFIALSTSLRDIDSVTENLLNFKTAVIQGNDMLIHQSYALLCNALDDVARYESFSLENIF